MRQVGIEPDRVAPAEIDETPLRSETPRLAALRLARAKAEVLAGAENAFVLAADTIVCVGRRILPKAEVADEARGCLELLSGRNHHVLTAVAVIAPDRRCAVRLVETRVTFKRLSAEEIASYLESGEWRGKAGGYAIQGLAGAFVTGLNGSYTGVVGLPIYESLNLLRGLGWRR